MNKNFLEHCMKTKPETLEQKYLFLVDSQELARYFYCIYERARLRWHLPDRLLLCISLFNPKNK